MAHHRADTGRLYGAIPEHAAAGLHQTVLQSLRRTMSSARVLDVGAGSGALTARLSDAGYEVTATELEPDAYLGPAPVVAWDACAPPPDALGTYDVICAVEVLEHVENPIQALRNFHALLHPGGLLIATTPHLGHPRSRIKFLLTGAPSYFGPREYDADGHRTLLPDWLLRRHILEAGFDSPRVSYAGRMSLRASSRWAWRLAAPFLTWAQPHDRQGDGCITVVEARKPLGSVPQNPDSARERDGGSMSEASAAPRHMTGSAKMPAIKRE